MKEIVINTTWGGFRLPADFKVITDRDDPALVQWVKDHTDETGNCPVSPGCDLSIALVPDEATDWRIDEYDGYETVTFVLNGKMDEAEWWEKPEEPDEPEELLPMFCVHLDITNWVRAVDLHDAITMTLANLEDKDFEVEQVKR